MAKATGRPKRAVSKKEVDDYRHDDATRLNNPEVGLARYETEAPPKARYEYDPHLDPQLQWAGKAEHTSFEVDAVSIHVHERLSTEAIVAAVRKEPPELQLFNDPQLERDKEIGFYQHEVDWTNRLILGDSLVVMTSLLERERLGGQVQCIYVDPPYGINYNSNFQANLGNRSPRETDDGALTREPEQIQAYRDTWTLGVHSYLTYLRDRLLLARELLADEGSIFVQIGDENVHRVRLLLDETFGASNFVAEIGVQKSGSATAKLLPRVVDTLLLYSKKIDPFGAKYRSLYEPFDLRKLDTNNYRQVEMPDGTIRSLTPEEQRNPAAIPANCRPFRAVTATSQHFHEVRSQPYNFEGTKYTPGPNRQWSVSHDGLDRLAQLGRLIGSGRSLSVKRYLDDFPVDIIKNLWTDTGRSGFGDRQRYVVQTNTKIVERCLLMATDPGDLVLDPTCGSGTTAYAAEKWGRRWIAIDTSRVALAVARERLLTSTFEYYQLLDGRRGVDGGFRYNEVQHVEPADLAYDRTPKSEALRNQPIIDRSKVRVSGPFTVEALSRYAVNPLHDDVPPDPGELNATADHVDQLLAALGKRGVQLNAGKPTGITSLTRLAGTSPLHGEGTLEDGTSFAVSIGPRYGPITVQQVDEALADAYGYDLVVFAGFAADAEAQKFLAPGKAGRFKVVLLEANADLLLGDLLRNTTASQTFRLFAAPDAVARPHDDGQMYVELRGVDVFDPTAGEATARGREDVAAWFLDHDYDGEVFHVCQAFFPKTSGWGALARALRGTLDEDALARLATFQSNPFTAGKHGRAAVRVVDFAGQTSETVVPLDQS